MPLMRPTGPSADSLRCRSVPACPHWPATGAGRVVRFPPGFLYFWGGGHAENILSSRDGYRLGFFNRRNANLGVRTVMPGPKQFVMSKDSADTFQRMVRDYKSGRLTNKPVIPPREKRIPSAPRLGKVTTAPIASDSTGEVTLQKPDWTDAGPAGSPRTITATNDTSFELPVDTKVYVQMISGKWRIFWGRIC